MNLSKMRLETRAISMTARKAKKSLVRIGDARKFVSYSVDRLDVLRLAGIFLYLMPEILDMGVYRPIVPIEIISLRNGNKLFPGKYPSRLLRNGKQDLELRGRQYDKLAVPEDLVVI